MPGCYGQALFCRQNAKKVLLLCVAAGLFEIFVNLWKSIFGRVGGEVLFDHQRYLKDDGVIEVAQIQAGQLADLLQRESMLSCLKTSRRKASHKVVGSW